MNEDTGVWVYILNRLLDKGNLDCFAEVVANRGAEILLAQAPGQRVTLLRRLICECDPEHEEYLIRLYRELVRSDELTSVGDKFVYLCEDILPDAYNREFYGLIQAIYETGYEHYADPVCGGQHPLVWAAKVRDSRYAEAYLEGKTKYDMLSFDDQRKILELDPVVRELDLSGNYDQLIRSMNDGYSKHIFKLCPEQTLLEELVLTGNCEVMELCIRYGANVNAFCWDGKTLLDVAPTDEMRGFLRSQGARPSTRQERLLVQTVNRMKRGMANWKTVGEILSYDPPLFRLSYRNANTALSKRTRIDLPMAAIEYYLPGILNYIISGTNPYLNDAQRYELLTVLRNRLSKDIPRQIIAVLQELYDAGFRYPTKPEEENTHPIVMVIEEYCTFFRQSSRFTHEEQAKVLDLLWRIGGTDAQETRKKLVDVARKYGNAALIGLGIFGSSFIDRNPESEDTET